MVDKTKIDQVKKRQKSTAISLISVIAIGMFGVYYFTVESTSDGGANTNKKIHYVSPLDQIDTQSVVLENTQKQLRDAETKTAKLQETVEAMLNTNQADTVNGAQSTESLKKRIDELESKLQILSETKTTSPLADATPVYDAQSKFKGTDLPVATPGLSENQDEAGQGMIREDRLALTSQSKHHPMKNPDTYVPSGTFVKAVVIGGADASTSVTAQANPKVMLLRLIENGTLPNHKKSHLKDCMAVGRVTGDISSERGSVSVERLSCVFVNNEVVDQKVEAIVFGPDGKVDVRGNVREGGQQYVGRAFAAGTLSGLSEGLSQTYTVNSVSPEGNVQTVQPGRIFQYGAAKGAGKAMDKLADYQMRKAEQFHPVIQLSAGTIVDVVFQMGFFLDGKNHEDPDKKTLGSYSSEVSANSPALFPAPSQDLQTKMLPLSQTAIDRIENYKKELGLQVNQQSSGS